MSTADRFDRLSPEKLRSGTERAVIGRDIVVLKETTSTNDAILRLASRRVEEGFVVFAESQTAGRGQRGHRWESAAFKGLWFSILLRPRIDLAQSSRLTDWAAQTIRQTLTNEFALSIAVKPPNDLQLQGKKVGGILVEMRAQKKAAHLAIVGIGINVNQSAEDFPKILQGRAISLAMALGRPVDRQTLAAALLRNLDENYGVPLA